MRKHPSLVTTVALILIPAALVPSRAGTLVPIYEIQGAGHTSPFAGEEVRARGFVTFVTTDGFYLQDPVGDGRTETSDGILVSTGLDPKVQAGDWVEVVGKVAEFIPGGTASRNLSITHAPRGGHSSPIRDRSAGGATEERGDRGGGASATRQGHR
ncbi:MAG: hypothetical protein GWO24_29800 [Akkermansiaceae bacterium]|nr:hypothetical protein [Akkermansiaceae bacterium]